MDNLISEDVVNSEELEQEGLFEPDTFLAPVNVTTDTRAIARLSLQTALARARTRQIEADPHLMLDAADKAYDEISSGNEGSIRQNISDSAALQKEKVLGLAAEEAATTGDIDTLDAATGWVTNPQAKALNKYAVEEEAVEQLRDMAASDSTQAQVQQEEPYDIGQEVSDYHKKIAILQNEFSNRFDKEKDTSKAETVLNWLASAVPLNAVTTDFGADGSKTTFTLRPGKELARQRSSLMAQPLEEFKKNVGNFFDELDSSGLIAGENEMLNVAAVGHLLSFTPSEQNLYTGLNYLDAATLIPPGYLMKGMKNALTFTQGLNRAKAVELATQAFSRATTQGGAKVSTVSKAVEAADAVEKILPSKTAANPSVGVGLSGDILRTLEQQEKALKAVANVRRTSRLSEEEMQQAAAEVVEDIRTEYKGQHLADVKFAGVDAATGVGKVDALLGKANGTGGYATEGAARNGAGKRGLLDIETVKDGTSGQWFIKFSRNVSEEGFIDTLPVDAVKVGSWQLGKWINPLTWIPRSYQDQLLQAVFKRDKLHEIVRKNFTVHIAALKSSEKANLNSILRYGEGVEWTHPDGTVRTGKWFTPEELDIHYNRMLGRSPSDKEKLAYYTFKNVNDLDYAARNAHEYIKRARMGYQNVSIPGLKLETNGKVIPRIDSPEGGRFYDVTEGRYYAKGEMTADTLKELQNKGNYRIVTLEKEVYPAGDPVKTVIGKGTDIELSNLHPVQVAYREGGHRIYSGKFFIKQAVFGKFKDGSRYRTDPITHTVFESYGDAERYVANYEAARQAVQAFKKGVLTETKAVNRAYNARQAEKFAKETGKKFLGKVPKPPVVGAFEAKTLEQVEEALDKIGVSSLDEWDALVREHAVSEDTPFEIVYNRNLPKAYNEGVGDIFDMSNPETLTSPESSWLMSNNRAYVGRKGKVLMQPQDMEAKILDPFEAQDRALRHAINSSAFGDYKLRAVEEWVSMAKQANAISPRFLQQGRNPMDIFLHAGYIENVDPKMALKLEALRKHIGQVINQHTFDDLWYKQAQRQVAKFVEKHVGIPASDTIDILGKDYLGFVRGVVFDPILGMFNAGQVTIQLATSLTLSAMRADFKHLARAETIRLAAINPEMLEHLATKWKLTHGMDAADFKAMVTEFNESGFGSVADSNMLYEGALPGRGSISERGIMDRMGPTNTPGSVAKTVKEGLARMGTTIDKGWDPAGKAGQGVASIRRGGRFFFHEANRFNRATAWSMAWDDFKKAFPGQSVSSSAAQKWILNRASALDLDMNHASQTIMQKGILGTALQFQQYAMNSFANVLSLTGSRWTQAERLKYVAASVGLFGGASFPFMEDAMQGIMASYEERTGQKVPPTMYRALSTGAIDAVIYAATGGDMDTAFGRRAGQGGMRRLLSDAWEDKPFLQMVAGPSYNTLSNVGKSVYDSLKFIHDSVDDNSLTTERAWVAVMDMAREVNSVRDVEKAYWIYRKGLIISKSGGFAGDASKMQALATVLGFTNRQESDASVMFSMVSNHRKDIEMSAKQIVEATNRAALATSPEQKEAYFAVSQSVLKGEDPMFRMEVLKEVARRQPSKFYDSISNSSRQANGPQPINEQNLEALQGRIQDSRKTEEQPLDAGAFQ